MAKGFSSNRRISGVSVIMTVVILAVLVLGVIAVWGTIQDNYKQNRLNSGNATASEIADSMGMSFDDFLTYYGLSADDGVTEDSNIQETMDAMTLENMSLFYWGVELTDDVFNAFKADQGIGDDVTKDTKDADVKDKYNQYQQAQQEAAAASEAPADASAAADTADTAATDAEAAADTAAVTEVPVETAAAADAAAAE
ncbi:MAG TPA: hypothetical protein IAA61_01690 [Candidatus Ornithomonoglobus merdipullorum]|uniref:Uncharacterized protein n=1 Tax=Candidatus Ornithomonoglobus merdipullorum TaxID=2840895 RepID=A0A9D1SDV8_9FIRM|nr:hypothetical protein [Candidatus Ornithomonoglobus merdipullorum]